MIFNYCSIIVQFDPALGSARDMTSKVDRIKIFSNISNILAFRSILNMRLKINIYLLK